MIAALRCMAQLFVVAVILQHVLVVKKLWVVVGIARMSFLALEPFPRVRRCADIKLLSSAAEYTIRFRNWCVQVISFCALVPAFY
jgi:hypothetical protein